MRTLFIALLVFALVLTLFVLPAEADPGVEIPWDVDCYDLNPWNGFIDELGNCVPGIVTDEAWLAQAPSTFWGLGDTYAPGMMEWICEKHNGCKGYLDGIALMTCGDIGKSAWLMRPGFRWSGPYLVVDCSHKRHLWHNVDSGLVVEWGYKTTERWGTPVVQGIAVHIGSKPVKGEGRGIYFRNWWMEHVAEFEVIDFNPPPYYFGYRGLLLEP